MDGIKHGSLIKYSYKLDDLLCPHFCFHSYLFYVIVMFKAKHQELYENTLSF